MIKIVIIISMISLIFSNTYIVSISTDYGDSIKVTNYHKSGELKSIGLKVQGFKHGKWKYFNDKGYLTKIEKYRNGKKVKNIDVGNLK